MTTYQKLMRMPLEQIIQMATYHSLEYNLEFTDIVAQQVKKRHAYKRYLVKKLIQLDICFLRERDYFGYKPVYGRWRR